jgi:hypothetical protein
MVSIYWIFSQITAETQSCPIFIRLIIFWEIDHCLWIAETYHAICRACISNHKSGNLEVRCQLEPSLELTHTVFVGLFFGNWCDVFAVLSNLVTNLLITISLKRTMPPSIFKELQAMHECPLHATSWAIECYHECIDRNWNNWLHLCEIMNRCNLQTSKFDFVKRRVFSEESADWSWNVKFGKPWQGGFEWYWGHYGGFLRHYSPLSFPIEFSANTIRFLISYHDFVMATCRWGRVESDLGELDVAFTPVSYFNFRFLSGLALGLTHEYPACPAL